ncbi:MAG: hypothetical protein U1F60_10560 [Planctomycetota bacterium]
MQLRSLPLLSLLLGSALAQQQGQDLVYPSDAPVKVGEQIWQACRVVDAVTGQPIAGAELTLIEARRTPLPREFWSRRAATSDQEGWIRVRSDDIKGGFHMLLLRAKGYGASAVSGAVPSLVWALSPAQDVPVSLRDWQERPVADTRIGLCLGSGNTPDVGHATTDANGNAVLVGIDPNNPVADVYPSSPGLSLTDYGRIDWVPGDHPTVVTVAQGHRVEGVLLDKDGKPFAGAFVGAPQVVRGPWAKTGADGKFVLEGAVQDPDLLVLIGRQLVKFDRPDGEQPFTLTLPELPPEAKIEESPDDTEEGDEGEPEEASAEATPPRRRRLPPLIVERPDPAEGPQVEVELQVVDQKGTPVDELLVVLRGPMPRFAHATEDVRDGKVAMQRLPGKYEATTESPRFEPVLGSIEVVEGGKAVAKLVATSRPLLQVRAENRESLGTIGLRTAAGTQDITDQFGADGLASIPVPTAEPFCFVVGNEIGVHVVRSTFADAKAQQPFLLRGLARTAVRGVVVGPDGKPVPADVALLSRYETLRTDAGLHLGQLELKPAEAGAFELTTPHEGLAFVVAVPRDEKLRPAILPVTLPRRGPAASADLGKLALATAPQFVVQHADGTPCVDAMAQLVRVGWHDVRKIGPMFALDGKGRLVAPPLRAGDAVVVPAADWDIDREAAEGEVLVVDLPFRTVLQGNGPWNVKLPSGRVAVTLKDKAGEPVDGRIFVADRSIAVPGRLELRQVPPGKHKVVVVSRDRDSVVTTIEVGAEGISELVVEMSDRH